MISQDKRILIRSSESKWPAWLLGGLSLLLMLAALLVGIFTQLFWLAFSLGGLGLLLLFVSFYMETQRISQLMYISLMDRGFTILDNVNERSFHDDDIVSIALQHKDNFDNGNHTSTTRTFRVWLVSSGERPELIEMKNKIKVGHPDLLSDFICRVVELLKSRADMELLKNQSVLGEGWELTGKTLRLRHTDQGEMEIPLGDLDAAQLVEDQLKLWKLGEEAAFASLPLNGANAHLLRLMLDQELARRPASLQKDQPHTGSMGRILFERKPMRSVGITLVTLGCIMLIAAVVIAGLLLTGVIPWREVAVLAAVAAGLAIVGMLLLIAAWVTFNTLFRCHERGVYLRGMSGERQLLYREVESFTYSATKHYHNGAYLGTFLKIAFIPFAELNKPRIVYRTSIKNADVALDQLREIISENIGDRMLQDVLAGKTIAWTDSLTLEPDRLSYRPWSLLGRKPIEHISYAMISHQTLINGVLSLFQHGKPKPFKTSSCTAPNFYPGYMAFIRLWNRAGKNLADHPVAVPEESLEA